MKRLLLLLLCFGAVRAHSASVSVTAAQDAYIRNLAPDANAGTEPTLVAGALGSRASGEVRRSLLRFDLGGSIPAGALVTSVSVGVDVVMVPLTPINSVFDLRRVAKPWSETGVTWNNTGAGQSWQTPGATGASDSAGVASSSVFVTGLGHYVFGSSAGLVADVQAWVNDPSSNFGWLMLSENETSRETARRFGAHEDPAHAPVLVIEYQVASLSIVTQPQPQTVTVGENTSFSVAAAGSMPIFYQWFFNGNLLAGQTDSTLNITGARLDQAGDYTVRVSNVSGSLLSDPAHLMVNPLQPGQPFVTIVSPTNGQVFAAGATVTLEAQAFESNGAIAHVQFFLNGTNAGVAAAPPYSKVIGGLGAGTNIAVAVATDALGLSVTSAPVRFSIAAAPGITLTSPADHSRFAAGSNVTFTAFVSPPGTAGTVHFFAGAQGGAAGLIGSVAMPPFSLSWLPPGAGQFFGYAILDTAGGPISSSTNTFEVFVNEDVLPRIVITNAPRNYSHITNPTVRIEGRASDNESVTKVVYQLLNGPTLGMLVTNGTATGTSNWAADVALLPGRNGVRLHAVDGAGNSSREIVRYYDYDLRDTLRIEPMEHGRTIPFSNEVSLLVGHSYTIRAAPDRGYLFGGWSGAEGLATNSARVTFLMQTGLVLHADFVVNRFPDIAGHYDGSFGDTNAPAMDSGLLRLRLLKSGAFSGKLFFEQRRNNFHGQLDPFGKALVTVPKPSAKSLRFDLDALAVPGVITGQVAVASRTNTTLLPLTLTKRP